MGDFLKRRREVLKRTLVGGNIGRTSVGRNLEMIDIFLGIILKRFRVFFGRKWPINSSATPL